MRWKVKVFIEWANERSRKEIIIYQTKYYNWGWGIEPLEPHAFKLGQVSAFYDS